MSKRTFYIYSDFYIYTEPYKNYIMCHRLHLIYPLEKVAIFLRLATEKFSIWILLTPRSKFGCRFTTICAITNFCRRWWPTTRFLRSSLLLAIIITTTIIIFHLINPFKKITSAIFGVYTFEKLPVRILFTPRCKFNCRLAAITFTSEIR